MLIFDNLLMNYSWRPRTYLCTFDLLKGKIKIIRLLSVTQRHQWWLCSRNRFFRHRQLKVKVRKIFLDSFFLLDASFFRVCRFYKLIKFFFLCADLCCNIFFFWLNVSYELIKRNKLIIKDSFLIILELVVSNPQLNVWLLIFFKGSKAYGYSQLRSFSKDCF